MKKISAVLRRLAPTLALVPFAALGGVNVGCGVFGGGGDSTQTMTASTKVPAGEGTVEASDGDNGNTKLAVRVKHLAHASMIASDATVYVVWIQPRNAPIQSLGALTLDDDLEGSLDAITPHRRFTVTVTPEPSAVGPQPTHEPVFTAAVDRGE
jgi:hypothetical protein